MSLSSSSGATLPLPDCKNPVSQQARTPVNNCAEVKANILLEMMQCFSSVELFDNNESDPPVDSEIWTLIKAFLTDMSHCEAGY